MTDKPSHKVITDKDGVVHREDCTITVTNIYGKPVPGVELDVVVEDPVEQGTAMTDKDDEPFRLWDYLPDNIKRANIKRARDHQRDADTGETMSDEPEWVHSPGPHEGFWNEKEKRYQPTDPREKTDDSSIFGILSRLEALEKEVAEIKGAMSEIVKAMRAGHEGYQHAFEMLTREKR